MDQDAGRGTVRDEPCRRSRGTRHRGIGQIFVPSERLLDLRNDSKMDMP